VTQNDLGVASVVYFYTAGEPDNLARRLAYRVLEDLSPPATPEHVIIPPPPDFDESNATFWGHWVSIDDHDYILTFYGPPTGNGDVHVALYDPTAANPDIPNLVTLGRDGRRNGTFMALDENPALPNGEPHYTLVSVRSDYTEDPEAPATFIEVYREDPVTHVWSFQYEFNAGYTGDGLEFVQSPELFTYGDRLFIVFVTSDERDFQTATEGNIWITRVEANQQPSSFKRRLNDAATAKRTEPEIHYLQSNVPVVFYAKGSQLGGDLDCPDVPANVQVNKLMRAKTGPLPQ
jgi:hypothetical protein